MAGVTWVSVNQAMIITGVATTTIRQWGDVRCRKANQGKVLVEVCLEDVFQHMRSHPRRAQYHHWDCGDGMVWCDDEDGYWYYDRLADERGVDVNVHTIDHAHNHGRDEREGA